MAVQEPIEFAGKTITPQNLYTALFVIGELGTILGRTLLTTRHSDVVDRRPAVDCLLDRGKLGVCRRRSRGHHGAWNRVVS